MNKIITKTILLLSILYCNSLLAQSERPQIKEIKIEGLKKSRKKFINKLIHSSSGRALDSVLIAADIVRLIREPAISNAVYEVNQIDNKSVNLIFKIEENITLIPGVDFWNTVDDKLAYHFGINDFNFMGLGYSAGVFYRQNIHDGYGFIFGNPSFRKSKFGYMIIGQHNKTLEPIQQDEIETFYDYTNRSLELFVDYELSVKNKVTLGIGSNYENYSKNKRSDLSTIKNNFKTTKLIGKILFDHNRIQYDYYINEGFRNLSNLTIVLGKNINEENEFVSFENNFTYYKKNNKNGNWATRIKLGFSSNTPTPFPAFVIDNNQNIRGSGNLVQRGSAIWILNTEYRHTLIEKKWFVLQANSFLDIGGIREPGSPLNNLFKNKSIHNRAGLGVQSG